MISTCIKEFRYPPSPYSFDKKTYILEAEALVLEFADFDIRDCPFSVMVQNITDPEDP